MPNVQETFVCYFAKMLVKCEFTRKDLCLLSGPVLISMSVFIVEEISGLLSYGPSDSGINLNIWQ